MYTVTDTRRLRFIALAIAMILGPVQGVPAMDTSDGAKTKAITGSSVGLPLKKAASPSGPVLNGSRTQPPAIPQAALKKPESKKKSTDTKAVGTKGAAGKEARQPLLRTAPVAKPLQATGQARPASAKKKPTPRINTTASEKSNTRLGSITAPIRIPTLGSSPSGSAVFNPGIQGLTKLPGVRNPVPGAAVDIRLAGMREKLEGSRMRAELERAGLGRELARESQIVDPMTGDPLVTGQRRYSGYDSSLGGKHSGDPLGSGRPGSLRDPVTGDSLLGGADTGGGESDADKVRAAGRFGKGMAMDDDDVVTDSTPVIQAMTFGEAHMIATGNKDGVTFTSESGSRFTFWATTDRSTGREAVVVNYEYSTGHSATAAWVKGEKGSQSLRERPRPDDTGSSAPQLSEAERQQILDELKNSFGPAGRPRPDDDGAPRVRTGDIGDTLTDIDLAGQPRPDDEDRNRRSGSSSGPVLTQLGLAGQPVDQDPDFGTLPLGGGGVGSGSGGFGAALVQDSNTGLKVPLNDAADRAGSRVDAQLDQME